MVCNKHSYVMERLAAPMMILSTMYQAPGSYLQSPPPIYGRNEQVASVYAQNQNSAYRKSYALQENPSYVVQRGPQRAYALIMPAPIRFSPKPQEVKREAPLVHEPLPPREYFVPNLPLYVSSKPESPADRRQELAVKVQQALQQLQVQHV